MQLLWPIWDFRIRIILQLGKEKSSWSPTNTFEEVSILHCFVFFLQWLIKHTLLSIGLILCVLGVNSWASLVAQQKRICLPMQERCGFDPWVWEDSAGGGNGNPLQYSCLENPMDRGAWQPTKSWTWLKRPSIAQEKTKTNNKKKMTVIYIGQSVAKRRMELVGGGGKKFSSRFKF